MAHDLSPADIDGFVNKNWNAGEIDEAGDKEQCQNGQSRQEKSRFEPRFEIFHSFKFTIILRYAGIGG